MFGNHVRPLDWRNRRISLASLAFLQFNLLAYADISRARLAPAYQLVKELAKLTPCMVPDIVRGVRQSVKYTFTLPLGEREAVISSYLKSLGYMWLSSMPCSVCFNELCAVRIFLSCGLFVWCDIMLMRRYPLADSQLRYQENKYASRP